MKIAGSFILFVRRKTRPEIPGDEEKIDLTIIAFRIKTGKVDDAVPSSRQLQSRIRNPKKRPSLRYFSYADIINVVEIRYIPVWCKCRLQATVVDPNP